MLQTWKNVLVSYVLNALWQAPLLYAAGRVGAFLLRNEEVRWRHRFWVGVLLMEVSLPAVRPGSWQFWPSFWQWLAVGRGHGLGSVEVVQGPGRVVGGVALPPGLLSVAAAAYGAVLVFFAGRLLWNMGRLARMRRGTSAVELSARSREIWDGCRHRFGLPEIALVESPMARSPLTLGVLRRTVVLPPGLLAGLSEDDQGTVFAHEGAHVKRYDFALNLLYEVLALPIAFHPCLWWTRGYLVESREWVCDALAVGTGAGAERYARSLLRLATLLVAAGPAKAPHAIGMLDANALERRLMQLQGTRRPTSTFVRFAALAGCVVVGTAATVSAMALHTPVFASRFAQEATGQGAVRMSGAVMAGNILTRVNPTYPPDARAARIQGVVVLGAVIGKTGAVENLQVISGPEELRAAALEAVRQWVYKPFLLNGEPTEVQTTINVNFQLTE